MKEHMTWHNCFSSVRAWFCSVHEKRSYNTLRYPMTNRLLLILYPIFIVCMAELNQDKYPSKLVLFITDHPTIMLFNVLIAGLIFVGSAAAVPLRVVLHAAGEHPVHGAEYHGAIQV